MEMRQNYGFSRDSRGDLVIPSSCDITDKPAFKVTLGKSGLISSQGISVSIAVEAAKSGSLSHAYS